jgi:hypothetical protein
LSSFSRGLSTLPTFFVSLIFQLAHFFGQQFKYRSSLSFACRRFAQSAVELNILALQEPIQSIVSLPQTMAMNLLFTSRRSPSSSRLPAMKITTVKRFDLYPAKNHG